MGFFSSVSGGLSTVSGGIISTGSPSLKSPSLITYPSFGPINKTGVINAVQQPIGMAGGNLADEVKPSDPIIETKAEPIPESSPIVSQDNTMLQPEGDSNISSSSASSIPIEYMLIGGAILVVILMR